MVELTLFAFLWLCFDALSIDSDTAFELVNHPRSSNELSNFRLFVRLSTFAIIAVSICCLFIFRNYSTKGKLTNSLISLATMIVLVYFSMASASDAICLYTYGEVSKYDHVSLYTPIDVIGYGLAYAVPLILIGAYCIKMSGGMTVSKKMVYLQLMLFALLFLAYKTLAIDYWQSIRMIDSAEDCSQYTNFNFYENLAALAFIVEMSVTGYVFNQHSFRRHRSICRLWTVEMAIFILIAAPFASDSICNYHPSSAATEAHVFRMKPILVVVCGWAYALPLVTGGKLFFKKIYNKFHPVLAIFTGAFIFILSVVTSYIFNMICYVTGSIIFR